MSHTQVYRQIKDFEPISLAEMDEVQLLNRVDRKYIVPLARLPDVIRLLQGAYYILDIEGCRAFSYDTTYFDTAGFRFYKDHHNGLLNRVKVRCREYKESKLRFFEIKKKTKGYRTDKYRLLLSEERFEMSDVHYDHIRGYYAKYPVHSLRPSLLNTFTRITLVNKAKTERCTVDLNLSFRNPDIPDVEMKVDDIVIIEVKQSKASVLSPVVSSLKSMRIYTSSVSKYVLGLLLTHPEIKNNSFKFLLHKIDKLKQHKVPA